jgi:hypothetical protein
MPKKTAIQKAEEIMEIVESAFDHENIPKEERDRRWENFSNKVDEIVARNRPN